MRANYLSEDIQLCIQLLQTITRDCLMKVNEYLAHLPFVGLCKLLPTDQQSTMEFDDKELDSCEYYSIPTSQESARCCTLPTNTITNTKDHTLYSNDQGWNGTDTEFSSHLCTYMIESLFLDRR